jgi:hypothetical protein
MSDDKYIKMVLALPAEFFRGRDYKLGDTILIKGHLDNKWHVGHIGDYVIEDGEVGTIQGEECEFYIENRDLRYLPNQKQLQDMAKKALFYEHGLEFDNWKLLVDFYHVTHDSFFRVFSPTEYTLDMMWLQYVVKILFNKKWNGEKWD